MNLKHVIPLPSSDSNLHKATVGYTIRQLLAAREALSKDIAKKLEKEKGFPYIKFQIEVVEKDKKYAQEPLSFCEINEIEVVADIKGILLYEPNFKVTLYFSGSQDTKGEESFVSYNYQPGGVGQIKKLEERIQAAHDTVKPENIEAVIMSICVVILKKAQEEMKIFKKWEDIATEKPQWSDA